MLSQTTKVMLKVMSDSPVLSRASSFWSNEHGKKKKCPRLRVQPIHRHRTYAVIVMLAGCFPCPRQGKAAVLVPPAWLGLIRIPSPALSACIFSGQDLAC